MGNILDITATLKTKDQTFTSGLKNASNNLSTFSQGIRSLKRELAVFVTVGSAIRFMGTALRSTEDGARMLGELTSEFSKLKKVVGEELNPYLWTFNNLIKQIHTSGNKEFSEKSFLGKLWSGGLDMVPILGGIRQANRLIQDQYNIISEAENKKGGIGKPFGGNLVESVKKAGDKLVENLRETKKLLNEATMAAENFGAALAKSIPEYTATDYSTYNPWTQDVLGMMDYEEGEHPADKEVDKWYQSSIELKNIFEDIRQAAKTILIEGIGSFIEDMFTQIGEGILELQDIGRSLMQFFGTILSELGRMYIAAGIAMAIINPGKGARMIAGGMALMAAGGLIKGLSNRETSGSIQAIPVHGAGSDNGIYVKGVISNNVIKISNQRGENQTNYHGLRY